MAKNMTLRLSDEDEKKLDFIKDNISYSCVYSRGLRFAISFTFELMKKFVLNNKDTGSILIQSLSKKYKIDIDHYRYY